MYSFHRSIFVKNTNSLPPVNPIGTPFIQLNQVDSTNNYAMRQVQAHLAEHGKTYLAYEQNNGRGQRGKSWQSAAGLNLTMSIVVEPDVIDVSKQFYLSMAVALACADLVENYTLYYTSIKWPNDIYWKDRKAGGILIENVLQGRDWKYSIIGVGLNVNQVSFSEELINPVSLKQVTGTSYNLVDVGTQLCALLEQRWQQVGEQKFSALFDEYNNRLFKRNEVVQLETANAIIEAKVIGVNESGELLINTGSITAVPFGSVRWML
jgi:BirA family transcriptional regulator, biotin operon repressor / biotin---[acetyl-CoA-carboxylase] ligase